MTTKSTTLPKGRILARRYRVTRTITAGGMGTIYEAFDTRLDMFVAVKENLLLQKNRKAAFRREAQFLANLRYPALPRVFDHFTEAGGQYLVMEYIEGDDLEQIIFEQKQRFPTAAALELAIQLLDVLAYLHNQAVPILHRDIKPSNLKVKDGRLYLLDFGLAYGQSGEMSTLLYNSFDWIGHSPHYSSPEQSRCEHTRPASDLYSFCATLYAMLTALRPPDALHRCDMIAQGRPDPLKDIHLLCPELENDVARAIMRGLSRDPHKRQQTVEQMTLEMFAVLTAPPTQPKRTFGMIEMLARIITTASICVAIPFCKPAACRYSTGTSINSLLRCETPANIVSAPESSDNHTELSDSHKAAAQLKTEAQELFYAGKYEDAATKSQEILAQAPNDSDALLISSDAMGDRNSENGDKSLQTAGLDEQADRILASVLDPITAADFAARAWANLVKGNYDQAVADATIAHHLDSGFASALMIRASAKILQSPADRKAANEALNDLDEVTRLRPNYPAAWANRGCVLAIVGNHDEAISSFRVAIQLSPRASFYVAQADSFRSLQQYPEAIGAYRHAIRINAKYQSAHEGLGAIAVQKGDWSQAIKHYGIAIHIKPMAPLLYERARAYEEMQKLPEAIQDFTQALKLDSNDYRSRGLRAYCYSKNGEWKLAISEFTGALSSAPAEDREFRRFVYEHRAEARSQNGQEQLAKSDERKAKDLAE